MTDRTDLLTARQREALDLYLGGTKPSQIAWMMGVSVKTVATHLDLAQRALGCRDRWELRTVGRETV